MLACCKKMLPCAYPQWGPCHGSEEAAASARNCVKSQLSLDMEAGAKWVTETPKRLGTKNAASACLPRQLLIVITSISYPCLFLSLILLFGVP